MRPLHVAVVLFSLAYATCLALHASAVGAAPPGAGPAWHVWRFAGAACLSATCVELVVWLMWAWIRRTGTSTAAGVPLRLTPIDRITLLRERPAVALLMPAHKEATTEQDREALAERIFDTIARTPSYATFFLLVDSPETERANELSVVRRVHARLRAAGRGYDQHRLVLEEYRDKPVSWRHKCGSLLMWLRRHGRPFQYMFVLDADSSLPQPDPRRPETCEVIERMAVAMREDPGLAIIQANITVDGGGTLWGRIQAMNTAVGVNYYFRVFSWLYGRSAPCYGHNCLIRVSDFARYVRNTLGYTSHDHIDSADLSAAGRACVLTDAVITYEQPEETLPGWLKRECRWSRGNGQWLTYLLRKRRLPAGVMVYLLLGVMQYVWALLASVLLVSAAVLVERGVPMVPRPEGLPSRLLVGAVVFSLVVPKLVATPSLPQFACGIACAVLIGPTLTLFQGVAFVLGAFGAKWVPRGARSAGFGVGSAAGICATFYPAMLLGLVMWWLISRATTSPAANGLIAVIAVGMILSPALALLLSWPLRAGRTDSHGRRGGWNFSWNHLRSPTSG